MDKTKILNKLNIPEFFQEYIPSLKVNGKPEALGLCPFHDDTNPSLSVNVVTGFFRCFACNAKGDVFTFYQKYKDCDFPTALQEIGKIAGVVEADIKPKVVATFKYTDEAGNLLYIKERLEPGRNGRSKEFFFKHLKDGKWVSGRGGDPVPYRLPEIMQAKEVFIVEGEAKADLLHSWGLTAICLDSGANSPLRAEYPGFFEGKESVTILPDNDNPGREYATRIANTLHGKVKELKIVELPGLQDKGDIIDWVKTPGNDKSKLMTIIENTAEWNPAGATKVDGLVGLIHAKDLLNEAEEESDWLWDGVLPLGGFSVMTSKPKVGKSTEARQMALHIAKGLPFYDREVMQGAVIYLALEDKRAEIRKHLKAMGMTSDDPFYLYAGGAPVDAIKRITADIAAIKPVLLVIDTLFRLIRLKDGNSYNEVTNGLEPLIRLARDSGVSILGIHHAKKGDSDIEDCLLGSTAIFGSVDTTILLKRYEGYRTIQSRQRYGDDMPETVLVFDKMTGTTDIGGAKEDQDIHSMENAIFEFLEKQAEPVVEKVITDEVLGKTALKRKALRQLVKEGQILRTGKGGKGNAFHYSCSPEFACSLLVPDAGNNKNSQKNDPEKNACSLVPRYISEQQNNNNKSGCEPHGYRKDSCSHVPVFPETEKNCREQAFLEENEGEIEQKNFNELCEFFEQKKFESINS